MKVHAFPVSPFNLALEPLALSRNTKILNGIALGDHCAQDPAISRGYISLIENFYS